MVPFELSTTGTVWTWTTQNFRPPPPYAGPEEFAPYHVGYVELPGEVIVETYLTGYGDGRPTIGDAVELTIIPFSTNDAGDEVVTYAFRPVSSTAARSRLMSADVAIIGVGLHPFGRFPGKSAIEMGAAAARLAMKDAGVEWRDVQFAFGGSYEVDNPDSIVNQLGLTGIPFFNMYNGCATAASVLTQATNTIRLGEYDIGMAIGMDKHVPGAFNADPTLYSLPSWYGEAGMFLTPKYFAEKIQRYMHDFDISPTTLARVAAKNFGNGALNENAFRRTPMSVEDDPRVADRQRPAHPVHVLRSRRGRRGDRAVPRRSGARVHRHPDLPARLGGAHPADRCVRGAQPVDPARARSRPDGRRVARRVREGRASGRRTSTSSSCRTPTPAPRCTTWPRTASAPTATRKRLLADGATEHRRPAADQHRRRPDRQRRADRCVGPAPDPRTRQAAARPGRRPPGPRQPEGRLRPALRRPRHRRRQHRLPLTTVR